MSLQRCAGAAALALAFAACAGDDAGEDHAPDGAPAELRGQLLVSAAASLTDAFGEMAEAFQDRHPGVEVLLNLGSSASLATQIVEGAPAHVLASANTAVMDRLVAAGTLSGVPRIFARNTLRIAVPDGNPAAVAGLEDFTRRDLRLGLCAEGVPCGDLARRVLEGAGIIPALDTEEPNVRSLLTKIELGELDAGITYVTDVATAAGTVEGIDIPRALNLSTDYSVAVVAGAPDPAAGHAFVGFVLSPEGRAILARHGFVLP